MSDKRKLTAINLDGLTPEVVVHWLMEDLPKIKSIFAMILDAEGNWLLYSSGNMGEMFISASVMNDLALRYLRGEIPEE